MKCEEFLNFEKSKINEKKNICWYKRVTNAKIRFKRIQMHSQMLNHINKQELKQCVQIAKANNCNSNENIWSNWILLRRFV